MPTNPFQNIEKTLEPVSGGEPGQGFLMAWWHCCALKKTLTSHLDNTCPKTVLQLALLPLSTFAGKKHRNMDRHTAATCLSLYVAAVNVEFI